MIRTQPNRPTEGLAMAKINFQNLNIEPMPNPKPMTVERVKLDTNPPEYGFIRNSRVDPVAHTGRG